MLVAVSILAKSSMLFCKDGWEHGAFDIGLGSCLVLWTPSRAQQELCPVSPFPTTLISQTRHCIESSQNWVSKGRMSQKWLAGQVSLCLSQLHGWPWPLYSKPPPLTPKSMRMTTPASAVSLGSNSGRTCYLLLQGSGVIGSDEGGGTWRTFQHFVDLRFSLSVGSEPDETSVCFLLCHFMLLQALNSAFPICKMGLMERSPCRIIVRIK